MAPKELVLVTGVTGYIGSWVCRKFLDAGFRVRGTVRSLKKESAVAHLQKWIDAGEPLELVEADLVDEACWPAACEGAVYVAHTASPFFIGAKDSEAEEKLYKPARQGTLNVLQAAVAAGTVKRIVLTSSIAAIVMGRQHPSPLREPETVWTDETSPKVDPYSKSKTMAERAAWAFLKQKGEEGVEVPELATVNPSLVIGPPLNNAWATSHQLPRQLLQRELPAVPNLYMGTVDVRDVADAHVRAIQVPEAAGKRFAVQAQSTRLLKWAKVLKEEFGRFGYHPVRFELGYTICWLASFVMSDIAAVLKDIGAGPKDLDCALAENVLGIKWTNERESIVEHVHACLKLGVSGYKQSKKYKAFLSGEDSKAAVSTPAEV